MVRLAMILWRGLKLNGNIAGRQTSKPSTRKPKKRKMLVICLVIKWVIELVQQTCKVWWSNKTKCLVRTNKIGWRVWVVSKVCTCTTNISRSSDHRDAIRQTSTSLVSHINNLIRCHRLAHLSKDLNHKVKCSSVLNNHHKETILVIIQEDTRAACREILSVCTEVKCFRDIIRVIISLAWAPLWVHHQVIPTQFPAIWRICSSRRA